MPDNRIVRAREIAQTIVDDAVSRTAGFKPIYDSVDLGETLIADALADVDMLVEALRDAKQRIIALQGHVDVWPSIDAALAKWERVDG